MKNITLLISLLLPVSNKSFSKSVEKTKTLTITNLPANYADRFTLVSLKTGKIVPDVDSLSDKWDIGFKGTTIIVNGGKIRKGQGGIALSPTAFNQIQTLSDTLKFLVDSAESLAMQPGSGNGWYSYNSSTHEILPIKNRTIIVKTAESKYAKVEILSYYKDRDSANESRYYTFRYNYQPDGSKTF